MLFLLLTLSFLIPSSLWAAPPNEAVVLPFDPYPSLEEQVQLEDARQRLTPLFSFQLQAKAEQLRTQAETRERFLKDFLEAFPRVQVFWLQAQQERLTVLSLSPELGWRARELAGAAEEQLTQLVAFGHYVQMQQQPLPEASRPAQVRQERPPAPFEPLRVRPTRPTPPPPPPPDPEASLQKLRFTLAERQYNQEIWKRLKSRLAFFKRTDELRGAQDARLELQIAPDGQVVERKLLSRSGSSAFDTLVLQAATELELPRPQAILVQPPPYIVVIQLNP